jgi:putative MATE family efflux protein
MQDLTQGSIPKHLLQMSAFIGAGMLVQTLYFLVDLYFVSRLGPAPLAGVSAAGNVMFIVMALTQVLAVGTVTLISHAVGRKDANEANWVFNQSVVLSLGCGAVVLIAGYALAGPFVDTITADAETAAAGRTYLYWYLPGLCLQFAIVAMSSALRGTGIVKPTMLVQSLTVIINIILAPILIAGWGTGRPLGVLGAALASSIAIAVGVVMLALYFKRLEKYVAFDRTRMHARPDLWKRLLGIGLPAGGEFMLLFLITAVIYWCVRDFGAHAQAGVGVGFRIMQAIFLPAMAVAFAVAPIAGQNFGARQAARVRETFRSSALMSVVVMAVLTLLCRWKPELLIHGFTRDPEVVGVAADYLRIVSLNFIANGLVFCCSGMFQALGNTVPSLISSAGRVLTFIVPAVWLSTQPWVKIDHFWYVSVTSVTLQMIMSLWLLRGQLRSRLAFPAAAPARAPAASG